MTDDPEPVAYGHYEFYTLSTGTAVRGDTAGLGPAWEFNYGIISNGQIHIILPLAFDAPAAGPLQYGLGDTELGFKYRFIDEDKNGSRLMVGVYPLIELPSGNESLGLGAGNMRAYLPLWVQRASAIGRPMAAAVTGSITATVRSIATTGFSVGYCNGR